MCYSRVVQCNNYNVVPIIIPPPQLRQVWWSRHAYCESCIVWDTTKHSFFTEGFFLCWLEPNHYCSTLLLKNRHWKNECWVVSHPRWLQSEVMGLIRKILVFTLLEIRSGLRLEDIMIKLRHISWLIHLAGNVTSYQYRDVIYLIRTFCKQ